MVWCRETESRRIPFPEDESSVTIDDENQALPTFERTPSTLINPGKRKIIPALQQCATACAL
jgi:hypothetical protein